MTAPHPLEEEIAAYAGGLSLRQDSSAIEEHLRGCDHCRDIAAAYEGIVDTLAQPAAPATLLEAARDRLAQRVRLRRFVDRFLSDPTWHSEVVRDPQAALERFRIQPTPELVAALKTLEGPIEVYGKELDERISKLVQGF
jgi:anti-sigma factor RsiW